MKARKDELKENGIVNFSNSSNENEIFLKELIKNKPESRELLFRLIDLLSEKVSALQDNVENLEKSIVKIELELNQTKLPEFLNCKQSCKLLQMSPQTLNQRRKEGKIKAFRIGKSYMYDLQDLLRLGRPRKQQ